MAVWRQPFEEAMAAPLTTTRPPQHDRAMNLIQRRLTRTNTTTAYGGSGGGCGCES